MEIKSYLNERKIRVENALKHHFPEADGPFANHIEAMRYSLFAGGKRIRPILCLAAAEATGIPENSADDLLPIACALECIHTYSLIHDDLPAMDNDELRRGKPTNHILFGEAGAILAGDGLLTFAFELITSSETSAITPERRLEIAAIVAKASGPYGMVGGQALDIAHENERISFEILKTIHKSKTGALITASVQAGAVGAGASKEQFAMLTQYGNQIGLAFQIVDDLLNATSTTEKLGKTAGSDAELGKATYPAFFGIEETRARAKEAVDKAKHSLLDFDQNADPLRALADYIYTRSH